MLRRGIACLCHVQVVLAVQLSQASPGERWEGDWGEIHAHATGDGKPGLLTEELSSTQKTAMSAPSSLLAGLWVGCGPSSALK